MPYELSPEADQLLKELLEREKASAPALWARVIAETLQALRDPGTAEEAENLVEALGREWEDNHDLIDRPLERLDPEFALKVILSEAPWFRPTNPLVCLEAAVHALMTLQAWEQPDPE